MNRKNQRSCLQERRGGAKTYGILGEKQATRLPGRRSEAAGVATRAPVAPPPPRAFAARGSGDPPGTPAHRSRARRPPCRGRPSTSGPSREPARPQLSAHSFPATLPAPKRYSFWPNAAAVGSTSCVFLMRHPDAPRLRRSDRAHAQWALIRAPVFADPGGTR